VASAPLAHHLLRDNRLKWSKLVDLETIFSPSTQTHKDWVVSFPSPLKKAVGQHFREGSSEPCAKHGER